MSLGTSFLGRGEFRHNHLTWHGWYGRYRCAPHFVCVCSLFFFRVTLPPVRPVSPMLCRMHQTSHNFYLDPCSFERVAQGML